MPVFLSTNIKPSLLLSIHWGEKVDSSACHVGNVNVQPFRVTGHFKKERKKGQSTLVLATVGGGISLIPKSNGQRGQKD